MESSDCNDHPSSLTRGRKPSLLLVSSIDPVSEFPHYDPLLIILALRIIILFSMYYTKIVE
jgi:hypothetical protein